MIPLELDPNTVDVWNYNALSTILPMEDIANQPELPWSKYGISHNNKFNIWIIDVSLPNAVDNWDESYISGKATLDIIKRYPHYRWKIEHLSRSLFFDIRMMEINMPNASGNWKSISSSHRLSDGDVMRYPELICKLGIQEIMDRRLTSKNSTIQNLINNARLFDIEIITTCSNIV